MRETVVSEILNSLRKNLSTFSPVKRAFAFDYTITIRDGIAQMWTMDTWDECRAPVHHVESGEITIKCKEVESILIHSLKERLVHNFHGHISMTITLKENTLAYSCLVRVQRKYDWSALAG